MKLIYKLIFISLLWLFLITPFNLPPDTDVRLQMAHALWTGQDEIPADSPASVGVPSPVAPGKRYYPYDMGQSLLMLPGDWVGTQIRMFSPKFNEYLLREIAVSLLVIIPLNILLILAIYWLLRLLDFSEPVAASASLVLLLGTTMLHYAQVFQQNNPVLLGVVTAYACILFYLKYRQIIYIFASGLALGFTIMIRSTTVINALTILGFLVLCILYENSRFSNKFKIVLSWSIGLVPFVFLSRLFNYWRFGSFRKVGQEISMEILQQSPDNVLPPNYPFHNPPTVGLWGALLSPAKSIFIYDPLLLPCLLLGITSFKQLSFVLRAYLISAIFTLIGYLILTSKLDFWHGDGAWAARYHVTSVHLILIPLVALLLEQIAKVKTLQKWLIISLIGFSVLVQLPSLVFDPSVNSGVINFAKPESFQRFRWGERVSAIGCLVTKSTSEKCLTYERKVDGKNLSLLSRVSLWPRKFNRGQNLLWVVWGGLFILAIATTLLFLTTTLRFI
jgi:hypothetical protein